MAQNSLKGMQKASGSGGRASTKKSSNPKKGAKSIPPKKTSAVVHRTMQKNLSAKINNSIEKQMVTAASQGKLTIMKGKGVEDSAGGSSKPLKYGKLNPKDRQNI